MTDIMIYIVIGVFFLLVLMTRFSPEEAGEKAVARRLWLLSSKKYFVINDLLFEKANGNTTQIDHVVVSPYGVFVIETKNISGYIYGSENSSTWTRHWKGYAPGGVYKQDTRTFDNPIHQNEAHVKALAQILSSFPLSLFQVKLTC